MLKMTCSVNTIASLFVTIVDAQLVFFYPPGWITAVIPASLQLLQSGKGKKAS
jgi:hypothetical protein